MALSDPIVTLAWLAKFELPAATVRLCDGGQVVWGAETFAVEDDTFGTITDADSPEERIGDEAPNASITLAPKSTAAAVTLSAPDFQGSPMTFWLAEVDPSTSEVVGTPNLLADMELDTTRLIGGENDRALEMGMISIADRLFNANEGNVLSTTFHNRVWPGEKGFDNATGVQVTVAWGVKGPPRGSTAGSGTAGGGGGGFGNNLVRQVLSA